MDVKNGGGRGHKRRNICVGISVGIIVIIIIVVILAFTVFKAKRPLIQIDSLTLDDLSFSLDAPRLRVNLNVTVDADISVKNPNKVGFNYAPTAALLNYKGQLIGEVPIPAGKISAGETAGMNLSLTLMADRLLSNSEVYSDVLSGALPLNTYTKISGKVSILNIFKVRVVSSSSCDFTVNVSNRTLGDQQCKYKTKL
ncbi:hypothetical protein Ddye_009321 [Dipteronia dyeriana]|uniref:Late embryogenesis abundant protein LEA-2 subgroup domain-containing protein n=1 Tax=Dipteronia dyeriana TaxID=168575 RepID=A0AAD9XB69_9ROSI|nr:hypothetical protein Ddye_009321 [Dipteronia dyeriana]